MRRFNDGVEAAELLVDLSDESVATQPDQVEPGIGTKHQRGGEKLQGAIAEFRCGSAARRGVPHGERTAEVLRDRSIDLVGGEHYMSRIGPLVGTSSRRIFRAFRRITSGRRFSTLHT